MPTTDFSVSSILESIKGVIGDLTQEEVQAGGNYDTIGKVLKAEQVTQEQAMRDASAVKAAEQAGILRQQERVSNVLNALNFDEMSVQLASKLRESGDALLALEETIAKKQSVAFLDNPLMWLGAQLSVQPDIERYNAEVDRYNTLDKHSATVNNMAQEVATTAKAALETVTADSAAAASRLAGVQYQTAAHEAKIKALANDTAKLKHLRETNLQQIAMEAEGRRLLDAEEDNQRQREAFKMQKEAHRLSMERAKLDIEAAKDAKTKRDKEIAFDAAMLDNINKGAIHIGRRPFSSMQDYELFAKSSKGNGELAQQMSNIGYTLKEAAATNKEGVVKIGEDAGDAAKLLVEARGKLSQSTTIDRFLKDTYLKAKGGSVPQLDTKNPTLVRNYVTEQVKRKAQTDARDITASKDNFYAPPTYAEVIAAVQDEKKLPPLYHKVFAADARANPMQQVDPAKLYHRTLEAVVAGTVTFNEAVDGLVQMGAVAMDTNNAIRNYSAVGIPEQTSFSTNTQLISSQSFFNRKIDLVDRKDLVTKLAMAVATKKATTAGISFGGVDRAAAEARRLQEGAQ